MSSTQVFFSVSLVKDRYGHDFWGALCAHFRVDYDEFKAWCVMWHQQIINGKLAVIVRSKHVLTDEEGPRQGQDTDGLQVTSSEFAPLVDSIGGES